MEKLLRNIPLHMHAGRRNLLLGVVQAVANKQQLNKLSNSCGIPQRAPLSHLECLAVTEQCPLRLLRPRLHIQQATNWSTAPSQASEYYGPSMLQELDPSPEAPVSSCTGGTGQCHVALRQR